MKLELLGEMTQLPDSQKVFGSLIYRYSSEHGEAATTKLVNEVKKGELFLALSNVLPDGYLPTPKRLVLSKVQDEENQEKENQDRTKKEIYKQLKARDFIRIEDLRKIIGNPQQEIFPYIKKEDSQQVHVSINSNLYDIPGLENELYSVPKTQIYKVEKNGEPKSNNQIVKTYCFYINIDEEKGKEFLEMLKELAKRKSVFVGGSRSSQGYNRFRYVKLEPLNEIDTNVDNATVFLNTGMLLPNEISYRDAFSALNTFTSERRPFEMLGGWNKAKGAGNYLSFISEGSVVVPAETYKMAGKSIESPFDTRAIIFGNAFLYPLLEVEGEQV
jgi:hypothetical protein